MPKTTAKVTMTARQAKAMYYYLRICSDNRRFWHGYADPPIPDGFPGDWRSSIRKSPTILTTFAEFCSQNTIRLQG